MSAIQRITKAVVQIAIEGVNVLVALGLVILLICNLRLYIPSPPPFSSGYIPEEVWAEFRYLRHAIGQSAGDDMQRLFPEGDFFIHVLYGLAWVNVGLQTTPSSPERQQALAEARWAWEELGAFDSLMPFLRSQSLSLEYGVFYTGWRNYLLSGILLLQEPSQLDVSELEVFQGQCDEIAQALTTNPTPFLQAYPGASWPVDTFPAVVSLRAHTQLVDNRYEPVVDAWLEGLRGYLDPNTSLIPHQVHYQTGEQIQGTRATSQVLILRFLFDLAPDLGLEQYRVFRDSYVVYLWGLPGVLEYPKGMRGVSDIDSGPLIEGVSLSATAIMLGTSRIYGDITVSDAIWHAGEVLGFPIYYAGMKRYWFGQVPVGDAFAVWSKTSVPWFEAIPSNMYQPIIPWWWRIPLNASSLGLGLLIVLVAGVIKRLLRHFSSYLTSGSVQEVASFKDS